jgi:tetratricopeptide (TPR) repeat protein
LQPLGKSSQVDQKTPRPVIAGVALVGVAATITAVATFGVLRRDQMMSPSPAAARVETAMNRDQESVIKLSRLLTLFGAASAATPDKGKNRCDFDPKVARDPGGFDPKVGKTSAGPDRRAELEQRLSRDPNDAEAKLRLIEISWMKEHKTRAAELLMSLVTQCPNLPIDDFHFELLGTLKSVDKDAGMSERTAELLRRLIKMYPDNRLLQRHLASLLAATDPEASEKLLEELHRREPNDADHLAVSAGLRSFLGRKQNTEVEQEKKALAELERAVDLDPDRRLENLRELTVHAFRAGDAKKTAAYADEMVREFGKRSDGGFELNYAHSLLGELAMANHDIEGAKRELMLSAEVSTSKIFEVMGPDLKLAKELLAEGERESVLEYIKRCQRLWTKDEGKLGKWAAQIRNGETPTLKRW